MAEKRYTIRLEALEVTMGMGIHDHERAAPQRVAVTVAMECAYPHVPEDLIDAVVDYDFLRDEIRRLAAERHFELQEVFCERIAELAMTDPRVAAVRVQTMKLDVYPDARVGCEISRSR